MIARVARQEKQSCCNVTFSTQQSVHVYMHRHMELLVAVEALRRSTRVAVSDTSFLHGPGTFHSGETKDLISSQSL